MSDWRTRLRTADGALALERAGDLDVDELRAWLAAHHGDATSGEAGAADVDPTGLFQDVWEANPDPDARARLTRAILAEYPAALRGRVAHPDYLGFLVRLMACLPLDEVPARSLWAGARAPWSAELRDLRGVPLRRLILQALFQRTTVSSTRRRELLRTREGANLAFRAFRDEGLEPAVRHLPALMATLDQPGDNPAVLAHLRALLETHGERALVSELTRAETRADAPYRGRLRELLGRLGVSLGESEPARTRPEASRRVVSSRAGVISVDFGDKLPTKPQIRKPAGNSDGRERQGSGPWGSLGPHPERGDPATLGG